jgi:nicotinic acid mononucleotide adenylyltransferase
MAEPYTIPSLLTGPVYQSYYHLLGVSPSASRQELLGAYAQLRDSTSETDQLEAYRFATQVLLDPYGKSMHDHYQNTDSRSFTELALQAGFFDNHIEPDNPTYQKSDPQLLTTPLDKLPTHPPSENCAVLVLTGGFAPVHQAHISILETAKAALQQRGVTVVGGYLSPSHDEYVSTKAHSADLYTAGHRLAMCDLVTSDSDWLMVDPYEALYTGASVNYTEVLTHLESYLAAHVDYPVAVHYVFGSDNAPFARAFAAKGHCVCVERNTQPHADLTRLLDDNVVNNPNVIFTTTPTNHTDTSSSAARVGDMARIHPSVAQYIDTKMSSPLKVANQLSLYALRDDASYGITDWATELDDKSRILSNEAVAKFSSSVEALFTEAVIGINNGATPELINLDPNEQQVILDDITQQALHSAHSVINLDALTNAPYRIDISRLFPVSSPQASSSVLIPRPGYNSITAQIASIPPGRYLLVDDDVATGVTTQTIVANLPSDIEITGHDTLMKHLLIQLGRKELVYDVVDIRDFLLGARDSGLVVQLPNGQVARAPYMLPYVNLATRAKLKPDSVLTASIALWALNADFFTEFNPKLTISDLDMYSIRLFRYLGFSPNLTLVNLATWHVNKLTKLPWTQPQVNSRPMS